MIRTLSQQQDRDQYVAAITAMLGLRGHMYGELIRIQMMLAKDDPHMQVPKCDDLHLVVFRLCPCRVFFRGVSTNPQGEVSSRLPRRHHYGRSSKPLFGRIGIVRFCLHCSVRLQKVTVRHKCMGDITPPERCLCLGCPSRCAGGEGVNTPRGCK